MKKVWSTFFLVIALALGTAKTQAQTTQAAKDSLKAARKAARAQAKADKAKAATTTAPVAPTTQAAPATNTKPKTVNQGVNKSADKAVGTDAKGRTIYEGPRGGRYVLTPAGKKEYIKKPN